MTARARRHQRLEREALDRYFLSMSNRRGMGLGRDRMAGQVKPYRRRYYSGRRPEPWEWGTPGRPGKRWV